MSTIQCTHFGEIRDVAPRTPEGCEECLKTGSLWVHLRLCLTCGHVGCCDNSPGKHATKHFHATAHSIISSRAKTGGGATSMSCCSSPRR